MEWIDSCDMSVSGDYKVSYNVRIGNYTLTHKGKEISWWESRETAKQAAYWHSGQGVSSPTKFFAVLAIFTIVCILLKELS